MSNQPLTGDEIVKINEYLSHIQENRLYELLGVTQRATEEQIRQAYHAISRQWHPDRFFKRDMGDHKENIENIFMAVTKSYRTLSNPTSRKEFDRDYVPPDTLHRKDKDATYHRHRRGKRRRSREERSSERQRERAVNENSPSKTKKTSSSRKDRIMAQVSHDLEEQRKKAHSFFEAGKTDLDEDRPIQAAASLHIACKLEPNNTEFKEVYKRARKLARKIKAQELFNLAESAESFQNYHEALKQYRKSVEYEVDDPRAYARLAYLIEKLDPDPRESIKLMQTAVQKDPENIDYRCILGEIYHREGMSLNAKREFNMALTIDRSNKRAKEGLKKL
jgi:curved DNA-binding protein CbpA